MRYTPVELRHVRQAERSSATSRDETERLLDEVADSFEDVWRERGELTDKVDELEKQLEEFKEREELLATTLVAAEKSRRRREGGREARGRADPRRGPPGGALDHARRAEPARAPVRRGAPRSRRCCAAALGIVEESRPSEAAGRRLGRSAPERAAGRARGHSGEFRLPPTTAAAASADERARAATPRSALEAADAKPLPRCRCRPAAEEAEVDGPLGRRRLRLGVASAGVSATEHRHGEFRRAASTTSASGCRTPSSTCTPRTPATWRTSSATSAARRRQPSRATWRRRPTTGARPGARGRRAADAGEIDAALARLDDGTYGTCERCGEPIGEDGSRAPVGALCIDDQRRGRVTAHRSEARRRPRRLVDERPARRSRSPSARSPPAPGSGPASPPSRSPRSLADQVTKYLVTSTLSLDESVHVVGPLSIHHVQNSGIAFGLFPGATARRDVVTVGGRGLDGRLLRALGRAPPGAAGRARAAARRQRLEPRRPRPPGPRHRLPRPRVLARVQPRGQLHRGRRRDPARRRSSRADREPRPPRRPLDVAARCKACPPEAAGERLDRFLAGSPRLAGGRRAGGRRPARSSTARRGRRATGSRAARQSSSRRRRRGRSRRRPPSRAIVWEDEHLLVVDKPAGPRRPSRRRARDRDARRRARAARPAGGEPERPGIVHRLDRDTSGLMVVARSRGGAPAAVGARARSGRSSATYLALVQRRARARAPAGSRRRSAATGASPTRMLARHRRAARRGDAASRSSGSGRACAAPGPARDRPDAPDPRPPRRRSTCPSSATRSTASPEPRLERQFLHATRARVPASVQRRAGRGRLGAAARPRGVPRESARALQPSRRRYHAARTSVPSDPAGTPRWTVARAVRASLHRGPPAFAAVQPRKGLRCPSSP